MPPFAANEAQFRFECSALAPDTFVVLAFEGEEAISRPYRFDLELASTESDVPGADVVGKPATLFLGGERKLHGVVSHLQQTERSATHFHYRVTLVPRLWLLSLTFQSEIYQNLSVQEILEKVFQQAGWSSQDYRFELKASYPPGEFVSQYQETNLAFVSRTMEQRGIFHYAWHDDERDVLVIGDDSREAPRVDAKPVPFNAATSLNALLSWSIHEFTGHEQLVPGQVIVKDYNYRTPNTPLVGEGENEGYAEAVYYEYGGHFKDQTEADALALLRAQELEAGRRVFEGKSNYPLMQPGFKFTLEGHFRGRYNAEYLVTSVRHTGSHRGAVSPLAALADGDAETYANAFTCIPLSVPFRPPRVTPVPRMPALTTARVETAGGPYAHVDEEGRYRAKMAYDRSDAGDGEASRPIRMSQPYSGAGYGMHFPNHADTELVVAHMNDDPDRPMAIGTVPNPANASPVSSGNKHENVVRSQGGNEIVMNDTGGAQQLNITAPYDNNITVSHDQTVTVSNNQTITVSVDRSKTVGANQTETVGGDKTITVGGNHTESIGGNETETVGGSLTQTVGTSRTDTVGTIYALTVGAVMQEAVGGAKTTEVGGALSVTVGGPSGETVGGSKSLTVASNVAVKAGGNFGVKAGGKASVTAAGKVSVAGATIVLDGKSKVTVKVGGSTITVSSSGIVVKGSKIALKASGAVTVKGSTIKLN